ncbi:hypothetical protein [Pelagibacterium montanilacus]|uniref:hypothetical protein n=1 Tax=Pelagibacterium montanilacus TaxID=2185280 RepID=UPI000F8E8FD9|nr:hypothetical protein [Pelagibacterium montanilacus]
MKLAALQTNFCLASALVGLLATGAALAEDGPEPSVPDGPRFVALYAEACFPERFSFDATLAHAQSIGWTDRDLVLFDPYTRLMEASRQGYEAEIADGFEAEMRIAGLWRKDEGRTYVFVVTEVLSEHIDLVGCYVYDFDATAPIDPAFVTDLLGQPIAYRTDGDDPLFAQPESEIVSVVWGPPPDYPRMLDTYLTFLPEGSPHEAVTGFSGLMIKSETSLP